VQNFQKSLIALLSYFSSCFARASSADICSRRRLFFENEIPVGLPLWEDVVDTYWAVGTLPGRMKHEAPFRGMMDPKVPLKHCKSDAIDCSSICRDRLRGISSPEPPFCIFDDSGATRECWQPVAMQCWDSVSGGTLVYDGSDYWDLVRHWRGDAETTATREAIQWIHLRSVPKKMDFFVFSSGRIRNLDSVDSEFIGAYIKDHLMNSIYPEHTVVLTGHSEGSGWAICASRHMHNLDFDNNRMVLGTGPLATEASVIRQLSTDTKQRTLFLMSAMRLPPNIGAPGIFPDVLALMEADRRAGGGVTFPQFGYGCISVDHERDIECLRRQPELSIEEGLFRANFFTRDYVIAPRLLYEIHSFKYYRKCYRACYKVFAEENIALVANVASYASNIPPPREPGSAFILPAEPPRDPGESGMPRLPPFAREPSSRQPSDNGSDDSGMDDDDHPQGGAGAIAIQGVLQPSAGGVAIQGEIQPNDDIVIQGEVQPIAVVPPPLPFAFMQGHRQFETHDPGGNTRFDLRRMHYSSSESSGSELPPPPPDDSSASGRQGQVIDYSSEDSIEEYDRPTSAPASTLRRSYGQPTLHGIPYDPSSDEDPAPSYGALRGSEISTFSQEPPTTRANEPRSDDLPSPDLSTVQRLIRQAQANARRAGETLELARAEAEDERNQPMFGNALPASSLEELQELHRDAEANLREAQSMLHNSRQDAGYAPESSELSGSSSNTEPEEQHRRAMAREASVEEGFIPIPDDLLRPNDHIDPDVQRSVQRSQLPES